MGFYYVLRLHVLLSVIATTIGCPMPCEIVSKEEGAEVQVICGFSRSLMHLKTYTVSVIHHPGGMGDPAYVLAFNRNAIEVQHVVAQGYRVDSHNETHVTFTVAAALHKHNGSYAVKVMSTSGNTTCAASSALNGKQAHVTCNFTRDVSQLDTYTVAVDYYPDGKGNPVPALLCTYIGTLQCLVADGYEFDNQIDYSLRLLIPEATNQHVGRYACDVMSPQIKETEVPQFCMLKLEDVDVSSSSTSIPLVVGATVGALLVGLIGGFGGGFCASKRCSSKNTSDGAKTVPGSPMSLTSQSFLSEQERRPNSKICPPSCLRKEAY